MESDTSLKHLHTIELPTPFPVGPVTVYLADGSGEPLTLVDTGPRTPEARVALEKALSRLGYSIGDIARVIVTHAHTDHFGLAAHLVDASRAQVWTHPWNVPALADYDADRDRRNAFYADILRQAAVPAKVVEVVGRVTRDMSRLAMPVNVDHTVRDGDILHMANYDWQVLHTPGHTAGLICLIEPENQLLLSSDHLLADISSNPVVEPPLPGETKRLHSLVLYRGSLRRVAAMDIARALPGHGRPICDVAGLVDQRLAFHEQRLAQVLHALRDGAQTTWEVAQRLFRKLSPLNTFLAVSEVLGHLEVLEIEGTIVGEYAEGVVSWRPV